MPAQGVGCVRERSFSGEGGQNPSVIFAPQDIILVPFSLIWTGFFVLFERSQVHGGSLFNTIYGIPFLVAGSYTVLFRFLRQVVGPTSSALT